MRINCFLSDWPDISGTPSRYNFSSWLRLYLLGCGVALFLRQLGPDRLPVVWAQVLPGHRAAGCPLDGDAALDRYRSHAPSPLPYKLRLRGDFTRQFCLLTVDFNKLRELHFASISAPLNKLQAYRSFFFLSTSLLMFA
jgi:hypothetical protein